MINCESVRVVLMADTLILYGTKANADENQLATKWEDAQALRVLSVCGMLYSTGR